MNPATDVTRIDEKIQLLKAAALELRTAGAGVPAVEKNTDRILASIKMLELAICDAATHSLRPLR